MDGMARQIEKAKLAMRCKFLKMNEYKLGTVPIGRVYGQAMRGWGSLGYPSAEAPPITFCGLISKFGSFILKTIFMF